MGAHGERRQRRARGGGDAGVRDVQGQHGDLVAVRTVPGGRAGLDGSDQRLLVLTPGDEPTERALRTLVTAHATTLADVG
ncbi:hypothetical protein [Actinomadura physcomitrii]|uniref:hypothetical protein n=1 Tax=Actinomadura physcomitrii TaxID=2650748 RepID=UPI002E265EB0